jgi:GxxExxY protein
MNSIIANKRQLFYQENIEGYSMVSEELPQYLTENQIATAIVNAAIHVHRQLGPGLLESVYEECLYHTLLKRGYNVEKQLALPVYFEEIKMEVGFRTDLLVEKKVIIEVKSVEKLNDIHLAQTLTYVKLSNCKLGILINFNTVKVVDGIRRVVNNL